MKRPDRRGAAVVLYLACLALAVLGVLGFSQAYTETTTLAVARSIAARNAALAVDSALAEAFAALGTRVNDAADESLRALRTGPVGQEVRVELGELPACRQAFGSDVEFEPVQLKVSRLKTYEDQHVPVDHYRYGVVALTARVSARIPGSSQRVRREATRVHELKISPATPPFPLNQHGLWIREFPYLNQKRGEYESDRDRTINAGNTISRRVRAQLIAFVRQMRISQQLINGHLQGSPSLAANPRWREVERCTPQTHVWSGIGVPPDSFPLEQPDWPQFPHPPPPPELENVAISNPVYFEAEAPIAREDIVLDLPDREDLTRISDPLRALPRRGGRVRVSLFDWPVSSGSAIMAGGDEHYRPSTGRPYGTLVDPYRRYRERLNERLEAARAAYAAVIDPYNRRLRLLTDEEADRFDGFTWPYQTPEFTRLRAAFVYPSATAFQEAHGAGPFTLFGVEYLDSDDDLDLSSRQQVRGPGTLGAKARLTVGPLARDGDGPITLIAGGSLSASGAIHASILCPRVSGSPGVSDARITGAFVLQTVEPETCGTFSVAPDPGLAALDPNTGTGLVANLSPAPSLLYGARE